MKRNLLLVPLCLFLLASCNLPLFRSPSIDQNEVNTLAAQTIEAMSNQTDTPVPTTETVQPKETDVLTNTPTETVSPTATTPPDDPRNTLGTPTFTETFSNGSSFGLKTPYTDDAITMTVSDGVLKMVSSRLKGGIHWRLAYLTPRNQYLEGTFKTVDCSGSDFYGLVLRSPDYASGIGYYFALSCAGKYSLFRMDGAYQAHALIDYTSDSTILSGPGQENRIGIMIKESQINLYINGKLVNQTSDDSIKDSGHYGVFQSAVENPSMTVDVEEINEWDLP
jgi:hypothetical protein